MRPVIAAALAVMFMAQPVAAQEDYASIIDVDGITLLHRHEPGSQTFSGGIYLLGGPTVAGADLAGLEPLMLRAAEYGSARYPGEASARRASELGTSIFVVEDYDWTAFQLTGLSSRFVDSWDVFSDRLLRPAPSEQALAVQRSRAKAFRAEDLDSPDYAASLLARRTAFADHPYGVHPSGTEETLARVTPSAIEDYVGRHLTRSRILVVIVGGVTRADAEATIRETFAELPMGDYEWSAPPPWTAEDATITSEHRQLPTNYIQGYFGGPPASDDGYPAFRLAVGTLGGFIFALIRNEGLSYAAGASVVEQASAGGAIYVSTTDPKKSLELINEAVQFMKEGTFRRSALQDNARNSMMSYYIQNQTSLSQAQFLAQSYLYRGIVQTPDAYVQELLDIDPAIVRRMANIYFKNIQWSLLGDESKIPEREMKRH